MKMDPEFMRKLVDLRRTLGFPFYITSGYRCPKHNKAVGGTENGPHTTGRAVDITLSSEHAAQVIELGFQKGYIKGLGVSYPNRSVVKFIHIDDLGLRLWSY